MKRVYSREVDSVSLRSNQALVRSIPLDNKQSLKTHLKPLGWKGYQVNVDFVFSFTKFMSVSFCVCITHTNYITIGGCTSSIRLHCHSPQSLQYKELTPNKTRRAQCANWLIYYREELFGYTIEELSERRRLKREAAEKVVAKAAAAAAAAKVEEEEDEAQKQEETGQTKIEVDWKPPVKEVF